MLVPRVQEQYGRVLREKVTELGWAEAARRHARPCGGAAALRCVRFASGGGGGVEGAGATEEVGPAGHTSASAQSIHSATASLVRHRH